MPLTQRLSRLLKYASAENRFLELNQKHQTAALHSLKIFPSNSIYTFIPKNACSTMRLSLAIANCCIPDASYFDWIHSNNNTFRASLQDLVCAQYTFVILRDPFARLASCFLDKIVAKAFPAQQLKQLANMQIELDDITFAEFVNQLADPSTRAGNMHWRPQVDFLVYDRYDSYFSFENLGAMAAVIEDRAGLKIVDARSLTAHGVDRYDLMPESTDHSRTPVKEIARLKQDGVCPHPRSLYTKTIIEQISDFYADDIKLYTDEIGPSPFIRTPFPG